MKAFVVVLLDVAILFLVGLLAGGLLWQNEVIPAWAIPCFLLPASLFVDYSTRQETHSWKILKISTSLSVFACMLIIYFAGESEENVLLALGVICFVPFVFAPEILMVLLGKAILELEDLWKKKVRQ
ncbi:MAG: hypothetical protein MRJ96_10420 [Nitrospirales bacterium]|nr:hypothetical protein [Nitrospira sp.]MDR4501853.1 hypothetical protein [Nitrospirales bacterium]